MNSKELVERTRLFAHKCVKLAVALPNTYLGNHIKGQLIRCSTSVGANYRATCHAQSRAAFIAKISIVIEECDESEFWQFSIDESLSEVETARILLKEAHELTSIFVQSRKTASGNIRQSTILNQQ